VCVQAGLLPLTELIPFTARAKKDGAHIEYKWMEQFFDVVRDDVGNVIACPEAHQQEGTYTLERLTWGLPLP
jgi:hypothetical protein